MAVGYGDSGALRPGAAPPRDAAAALAGAAARDADLAFLIDAAAGLDPAVAFRSRCEGMLLARYRYDVLKGAASGDAGEGARAGHRGGAARRGGRGRQRGLALAQATMLARDLANTPPRTSPRRGSRTSPSGSAPAGLGVEVFDRETCCGSAAAASSPSTAAARTSRGSSS